MNRKCIGLCGRPRAFGDYCCSLCRNTRQNPAALTEAQSRMWLNGIAPHGEDCDLRYADAERPPPARQRRRDDE